MKAFVTGGGGFLGAAVVRKLLARGDDVVALARSHEAAAKLTRLGATPVRGGIADTSVLDAAVAGVDAVVHVAGVYRVGVKESEHEEMFQTNVDGTMLVLDAAIAAGVPRIVHVSTISVLGNTRGRVADETYERADRNFLSYYEATKYFAHHIALARAASGAPVVIAMPGTVYGPGDHSETGRQIELARRGKYRVRMFPELGLTMSYVDDVAEGLLAVTDRGRARESYILGGDLSRLGIVLDKVAELNGHRKPRITLPRRVVRAMEPVGPVVGPLFGAAPNLHEMVRSSRDVTYWATSTKAEKELGYSHRPLDEGLRELFAAT